MPGLITEFLGEGTAAGRPATPDIPSGAIGFYWSTDTDEMSAYVEGAWIEDVFAGGAGTAASTTEQLTGTDTTKFATADSVAALWEQGSDVASAGTISLGEGGYFFITGTTTITDVDFATDKAGRMAWVKFAGILTLTHHSTTLILPTGANITTAAGDTALFISEGSDNVRCVAYNRASGAALVGGGGYPYEAAPTTVPDLSAFSTWRNQGTAAATADAYGVYLDCDNDDELHIREMNLPSTPFSYYARIRLGILSSAAHTTAFGVLAGFVLVNSTSGRVISMQVQDERVSGDEQNIYSARIIRWSSVTSASAIPFTKYAAEPFHWLRIDVTSTDVTFYVSVDGRRWVAAGSAESFASYVTATGGSVDKLGICVRAVSGMGSDLVTAYYDVLQDSAP